MVQLCGGIVRDTLTNFILVSSVSLSVFGPGVVLIVVPDTPSQLRETSRFGTRANELLSGCHWYVILHVALRPSLLDVTISHAGSATEQLDQQIQLAPNNDLVRTI